MKKTVHTPFVFHSIADMNKALGMPEPTHPLIALNDYKDIKGDVSAIAKGMIMDFYKISYKKSLSGRIRYGQHHYDFQNGGLSFIGPHQLIAEDASNGKCEGFTLLIHPDFLSGYSLAKSIKNYGFFAYSANEALQLTEKEKETLFGVFKNIEDELSQRLDHFSQDVMISQIELLLNYSNRFYNRQFLTQKATHHDLLTQLETLLEAYFNQSNGLNQGLPTVQFLADNLHVSSGYLSDVLRNLTGLNAQQHIHQKLIEKAKEYLSTDNLTVAEIAYLLGFEHPQSFNKLFKKKTSSSPLEYRQSFN
jgi:AraC family transcriptional regulator, transcriptional activator of pobA